MLPQRCDDRCHRAPGLRRAVEERHRPQRGGGQQFGGELSADEVVTLIANSVQRYLTADIAELGLLNGYRP